MQHPTGVPFDWDDLTFHALSEDLAPDQRWSTWGAVERSCRGATPWPPWLVTSAAAIDTDLGLLKTGKEADVHLLERAVPGEPGQSCLLAAKRYRDTDHRLFHRDTGYVEGRRVRNSRDTRAMERKSAFGRSRAAGLWATAEWTALNRLHRAGVPVPYPVQLDGTELLLEFIGHGQVAAPRLHQLRPPADVVAELFHQAREAMHLMTALGVVHGDLSPFNILVAGSEANPSLVIIDVPQLVDLVANPNAAAFLHRDCTNVASWFTARGLAVDAGELLAELLARAW